MNTLIFDRLKKMDEKIGNERTGTPEVFARTIGVAERSIYSYITLMRKLGADIGFRSGNYYYKTPGRFKVGFEPSEPASKTARGIPGVSSCPAITHD